ncbi:hypothetical protein I317_04331 [Kwoniella heveanensis CBS 569]|nr:hypothetical protein I317_04331 [Kwoniella heveanensis CBS 569]
MASEVSTLNYNWGSLKDAADVLLVGAMPSSSQSRLDRDLVARQHKNPKSLASSIPQRMYKPSQPGSPSVSSVNAGSSAGLRRLRLGSSTSINSALSITSADSLDTVTTSRSSKRTPEGQSLDVLSQSRSLTFPLKRVSNPRLSGTTPLSNTTSRSRKVTAGKSTLSEAVNGQYKPKRHPGMPTPSQPEPSGKAVSSIGSGRSPYKASRLRESLVGRMPSKIDSPGFANPSFASQRSALPSAPAGARSPIEGRRKRAPTQLHVHETLLPSTSSPNAQFGDMRQMRRSIPRIELNIGIPCIVSLVDQRARFRGLIRFIGKMDNAIGPWVGIEVEDLSQIGVKTLPFGATGGVTYFDLSWQRDTASTRHPSSWSDRPSRGRATNETNTQLSDRASDCPDPDHAKHEPQNSDGDTLLHPDGRSDETFSPPEFRSNGAVVSDLASKGNSTETPVRGDAARLGLQPTAQPDPSSALPSNSSHLDGSDGGGIGVTGRGRKRALFVRPSEIVFVMGGEM